MIETSGSLNGGACIQLAELPQTLKHRAVLCHVEVKQLLLQILLILDCDMAQKVDVIFCVESLELSCDSPPRNLCMNSS